MYSFYPINCLFLSADIEVRRKAVGIALSMTSSRNVEEVVLFLKKQLQKTQEADFEKVCFCPLSPLINPNYSSGLRIPPAPYSIYPRYCHQILRSRS